MRTVEEATAKLAQDGYTGTLCVEYVNGAVIEMSRQHSTVPFEDQMRGVLELVDVHPDAEIRLTWVGGIIRHVEVVSAPVRKAMLPSEVHTHLQGLSETGFYGTTSVLTDHGRVVECCDHRVWKAQRDGTVLKVLRERLA